MRRSEGSNPFARKNPNSQAASTGKYEFEIKSGTAMLIGIIRVLLRASMVQRPATASRLYRQTLRRGHPRIDGNSFLTRCSTSLHSAGVSFTAPTNWLV